MRKLRFLLLLLCGVLAALAGDNISGRILDPQGRPVEGAAARLQSSAGVDRSTRSDGLGNYRFDGVLPGEYRVTAEAPGFTSGKTTVTVEAQGAARGVTRDVMLTGIASQQQSIVIVGKTVAPEVDLRNHQVFDRTLFTRDDQVLQQLNAGINAGQHEGGGKSLEIRRFGFNLDHGGVNGGLKVLVDDVQQNQGTQGHGQGYLGALKALSPELIQDATLINGPFSAEYGDFSGLGVVHIRQRESLADPFTVRLQGGNFNTGRGVPGIQSGCGARGLLPGIRGFVHRTGPFRVRAGTGGTMSTAITRRPSAQELKL